MAKNIVVLCDGTRNRIGRNLSNVLKLFRISAVVATVAAAATANAEGTARNEHNYTLTIDLPRFNAVNRMWSGDVVFAISACPQARCFHVSGRVSVPPFSMDTMEGSFPLTGLPCDLHFQNIPRNGYDSPDWRLTLISRNEKWKWLCFASTRPRR